MSFRIGKKGARAIFEAPAVFKAEKAAFKVHSHVSTFPDVPGAFFGRTDGH